MARIVKGVNILKLYGFIAISLLVFVSCGGDSDIKVSSQQNAFESKIYRLKQTIDRAEDTQETQNKYVSEVSGDPVDNAWQKVQNFKDGRHRLNGFVGTVEEIGNDGTIEVLHGDHIYFLEVDQNNAAVCDRIAKLSSGDVIYFDAETCGEKSWTKKGFLKEPEWEANLLNLRPAGKGSGPTADENRIEVVRDHKSQSEFFAKVYSFEKLIDQAKRDDNEFKVRKIQQLRGEVLSKYRAENWVGELVDIIDTKTEPVNDTPLLVIVESLASHRSIALRLEYRGREMVVPVYTSFIISENLNTKERIFQTLGQLAIGDKVTFTGAFSGFYKDGFLKPKVLTMDKTESFRKA